MDIRVLRDIQNFHQVINFITNTLKDCKVKLLPRGKSQIVCIQSDFFQGDSLSPLLLIMAMKPLNYIP